MSKMEELVGFALAAAPGVVALEIAQAGRPPLRPLDRGRELAYYLLFSAGVWAVAALLFDAREKVDALVRFNAQGADSIMSVLGPIVGGLLVSALIVGLALRLALEFLSAASSAAYQAILPRKGRISRRAAAVLSRMLFPASAWNRLLARVRASGTPQVVHVRLQDGRDIYGIFAGSGRADWDRDGQGLMLDLELFVNENDELVEIDNCRGLFVPPEVVASVTFADYNPPSGVTSPHG